MKRKLLLHLTKSLENFELLSLSSLQKQFVKRYGMTISKSYLIKVLGRIADRLRDRDFPHEIHDELLALVNKVGGKRQLQRLIRNLED